MKRLGEIEPALLRQHQRLAGGDEVDEGQHVGDDLDHRRRADRAHQERARTHRFDCFAVALVEGGVAADQCRDFSRGREVDATGDGALQRLDAPRGGKRRETDNFVAAVGRHLDPGSAPRQAFQQPSRAGEYGLADLGRGQAGDGVFCAGRRVRWRGGGGGAERYEARDRRRIMVVDGDVEAVADERGGEMTPEMAEADEGVCLAHGINGVCIICR